MIGKDAMTDTSRREFLIGASAAAIMAGAPAAVAPQIPDAMAKQTLDVSGKLVFPGLVDFHAHVFYRTGIGLPADELVPMTGTTTYVSAGDAGVGSFSAFKHL